MSASASRKAANGYRRRAAPLLAALVLGACSAGGEAVPIRPRSHLALRFEATIPQMFDYTCGAASVATILTYYWGQPTSEKDAVEALRARYSLEEIARRRETGLSFDDLAFMASRLGFAAEGARIEASELAKLEGPVIVHLDKKRFQHFAVLRRVGDGVYYVSDPIVGQRTMDAEEFRREFTGTVLAIWREGTTLPRGSVLMRPRDGLSVTKTLGPVINAPPLHVQQIL